MTWSRLGFALFGCVAICACATAQTLTIDGVTDRSNFRDRVGFRVRTDAGFTYVVTLNGKPVPAGVTNFVDVMDYYDLVVRRTQTSDGTVTNRLVRFIVESSRRLKASDNTSPELGLIEWTPLPPIPSTAAEISGGVGLPQLRLMMPSAYPAGLEIPVVLRVENSGDGSVYGFTGTRRVNAWVTNTLEGLGPNPTVNVAPFRLLRGVGHGFLPSVAANQIAVNYTASIGTLSTGQVVTVEANTTWTPVTGILGASTIWPPNSRIHVTSHLTIPAGGTLTIGEGTVVRLNPGVNITNSGRTVIDGTTLQPVVFTATNRVAPEQRPGAWGGWIMRGGELIATAAIMTGSGAAASLSYSPGSSHRSEQPLLFAHNSVLRMTNCALINLAGQVGNGYHSSIFWDRCLIQRAITCGEYDGGTNIIKDSAVIEFPAVDGVYNATIADADYDGFYTINTTNFFVNSLFGFAKDDAIDSGSGGPGSVVVSNCWIESALHEALAWSGEGRRTWTYDSVLINCGQGLECGWSTGTQSPLVHGEGIFSTANSVGSRYGDNYTGTTGLGLKDGFLTVTSSIVIYNYRDVWGQVWDNTWNYRVADMDIRNNRLTAPNTNHPNNLIWNPASDAWRLASFMSTPPDAPVGIGLANWDPLTFANLTNGVPVRLSCFTTNIVYVDYTISGPSGPVANGTLKFDPGETVKRITVPGSVGAGQTLLQLALSNPVNGEITGGASAYVVNLPSTGTTGTTLIPFGAPWKYLDDGSNQGTTWRLPGFSDTGWSNGVAQLGFGDGDENPLGLLRRTNSVTRMTNATFYFRRTFNVANPSQFGDLSLQLLRDDAGIVYLNGGEIFRSPNLPAGELAYNFVTSGNAPPDNTIDTTNIVNGASLLVSQVSDANLLAVEIHQQALSSSDVSFDLELIAGSAQPPPTLYAARFGSEVVLYWSAPGYVLKQSDNIAPTANWSTVPGASSPLVIVPADAKKFYRLERP